MPFAMAVLSRHTVLPWEDRSEYESLLNALVVEHAPDGPTEEHLVEELTGTIWRKRRLRMAEAAVYREKLRHDTTGYQTPEHLVGAALLPLTGRAEGKANIPQALVATPAGTARDLRDVKRDQTMTRNAWNILVSVRILCKVISVGYQRGINPLDRLNSAMRPCR